MSKKITPLLAGLLVLLGVLGIEAVVANAQSYTTSPSTPSASVTPSSNTSTSSTSFFNYSGLAASSSTQASSTSSLGISTTTTGSGISGNTTTNGALGAESLAQTSTTGAPIIPIVGTTPAPTVVTIDDSGNALVRGVVKSITPTQITISSWGGLWTINSGGVGSTMVIPSGINGASDFTKISVGDFVGVQGLAAMNGSMVVNASLVRDWTTNPYQGSSLGISSGLGGSASSSNSSSTSAGAPMIPATSSGTDNNGTTGTGY